jgi:hypothetical protein
MSKESVDEALEQFRDANSEPALIELLMDKLVEELEGWDISTERQKHDLNMKIRDLEEELDYIESDKLAEFDPEQG